MAGVKPVVNNWTLAMIGTLQSGRPYPVSTGDGAIVGSAFPALGSETNQRPNICTAGSTLPACAGAPIGTIVTTNIAATGGSNVLLSQNAVAACNNPGLLLTPATVLPPAAPNCSAIQTTFLAPAGASSSGPIDSYTGDPVAFHSINGNLVRNAGQSLPIYQFDFSAIKAFTIPGREGMRLELKFDAFNVFNHPEFILNTSNDALSGIINLPALTANGATNPNFNCTAGCINPFSGLYLGNHGAPLNISK